MSINRLSDRLRTKMNSGYGPEDTAWLQYMTDNKFFLRQKSKRVEVTMLDMVKYRYRPNEFYASHGGDLCQTWIFLMINDIRNLSDFNESVTSLWIPDPDTIRSMKRSFDSSLSRLDG